MTIYLDLVFIINFCYDFLLLMTVSITLKRNINIIRIIFGALFGVLTLGFLFLNINNGLLIFLKITSGLVMCFITFGIKKFKYNLLNILYLYMCSVILGGFLYLLDIEFSYKHEGLIFYFSGLSINYILLIIIAPIILFLYIKQNKILKIKQNLYYNVKIVLKNNKVINVVGYLDTANKLKDPITKKNIIVIEKKIVNKINIRSPIYIPYKAINYQGLLLCFSPKYIVIDNKNYDNYLLGVYDGTFNIEGVNCILNKSLMED